MWNKYEFVCSLICCVFGLVNCRVFSRLILWEVLGVGVIVVVGEVIGVGFGGCCVFNGVIGGFGGGLIVVGIGWM